MMFTVTMVMMIAVFVEFSKERAVEGTARELGTMWTESILAGYDLNLYGRYGLLGFYGNSDDIEGKIDMLAHHTYMEKPYVKYDGCSVDMFSDSLGSLLVARKQIVKMGQYALAGNELGPASPIVAYSGEGGPTSDPGTLFSDLPSGGTGSGIMASKLKSLGNGGSGLKDLIRTGTDRYFLDRYAKKYLKDQLDERDLGNTYLSLEREYLICGRKSDEDNRSGVKRRLIVLRTAANLAFALTDEKMRAETYAAAMLIAPEFAPVAQKVLTTAWAAAEAANDYQILVNGGKVPLRKTGSSWALKLDTIVSGTKVSEDGKVKAPKKGPYVDPKNSNGEDYSDYLSILCALMDQDRVTLRIMDVIQINMRYAYYSAFRLEDHNVGLTASFRVNENTYEVRKAYDQ